MNRYLLLTLLFLSPFISAESKVYQVPLKNSMTLPQSIDLLGIDAKKQLAFIRLDEKSSTLKGLKGVKAINDERFVSYSLDKYLDSDKLTVALKSLASTYPSLSQYIVIGHSSEGRPIQGLLLSSQKGHLGDKPSILFNGMHHAREVMTTEVVYDIADYLLSHYGQDDEVTHWLDNYQVIVLPQINPDGNQRVHGAYRWWRKNTWVDDGEVYGVDLNRNYPYLWNACGGSSGSRYSDAYRGPSQGSEPETQALMNAVEKYQPVFDISYHAFSELIIYPFGCPSEVNHAKALFQAIAKEMNQGIVNDSGNTNAYLMGSAPELLYPADGSDLDYQWAKHNVMAYAIEVNNSFQGFQPDYDVWRDKTLANQRGGWQALLRRMDKNVVKLKLPQGKKYHYRLYRVDENNHTHRYQYGYHITKRLVKHNGLIYQPLTPGRYIIEVEENNHILLHKAFVIGSGVTHLGSYKKLSLSFAPS